MNYPPKGYNQLRKGRVSAPGMVYFITKNTAQRLTEGDPAINGVLMGKGAPETIINTLQWLQNDKSLTILCYVIMPDHIHLLFELGAGKDLDHVMRRFSSYTSREIAVQLDRTSNQIWQAGYYDRTVRNERELLQFRTYIAENPLKAGYVQNIEDWPWLYGWPYSTTSTLSEV